MTALRGAIAHLLSQAFHLHWRWSRGMTLGVRGLTIDADGRVFLIRHTYVAGWQLPGGGVEAGETLVKALARELLEEGNIEILGVPELHGVFFNAMISRRDHVAVYIVRSFRQASMPMPNREIAEHGFFFPDALPQSTTTGTRARVAEVLSGAHRSERW